jgi:hypothetical protein
MTTHPSPIKGPRLFCIIPTYLGCFHGCKIRGWKIKSKLMVNVTSLGVGFVFFWIGWAVVEWDGIVISENLGRQEEEG